MGNVQTLIIALLLTWLLPVAEARAHDLQATAELLSAEVLPYQAARLRLTLRNVGTEAASPLTWLDERSA